ncbi:MarR family winged helix-turn-helix transcriptional regulator [Longivirga aurantiaca]|uniref:MarR family winged helix-turn-helix transcriptional regulator n=1 Tax=Longivirga aurantiaca TaxID=1837743 RepID=A0ABW1T4I9_9ACTN
MADDVPWLTPEQLRSWIALSVLLEALPAAIDAQLKRDAGLNSFEYQVMAGLSDAPDHAIRMSALAAFASGSPSRLSHAVGRLEKQGFVVRRQADDDPRAVEAVLTPAGRAKMKECAPAHVREARRLVVDVLTPTQLDQLGRIARKVLEVAAPQTAEIVAHGHAPTASKPRRA